MFPPLPLPRASQPHWYVVVDHDTYYLYVFTCHVHYYTLQGRFEMYSQIPRSSLISLACEHRQILGDEVAAFIASMSSGVVPQAHSTLRCCHTAFKTTRRDVHMMLHSAKRPGRHPLVAYMFGGDKYFMRDNTCVGVTLLPQIHKEFRIECPGIAASVPSMHTMVEIIRMYRLTFYNIYADLAWIVNNCPPDAIAPGTSAIDVLPALRYIYIRDIHAFTSTGDQTLGRLSYALRNIHSVLVKVPRDSLDWSRWLLHFILLLEKHGWIGTRRTGKGIAHVMLESNVTMLPDVQLLAGFMWKNVRYLDIRLLEGEEPVAYFLHAHLYDPNARNDCIQIAFSTNLPLNTLTCTHAFCSDQWELACNVSVMLLSLDLQFLKTLDKYLFYLSAIVDKDKFVIHLVHYNQVPLDVLYNQLPWDPVMKNRITRVISASEYGHAKIAVSSTRLVCEDVYI